MSNTHIEAGTLVDARGLACPMPIVKTAKAMKALEAGQVVKLIATVEWHQDDGAFVFYLRKGGAQRDG